MSLKIPKFDLDPAANSVCGLDPGSRLERVVSQGSGSIETHDYTRSLSPKVKLVAQHIHGHGGIGNRLPWCMNVVFNKDRLCDQNSVANSSAARRRVVQILRRDSTTKVGGMNKLLKAA